MAISKSGEQAAFQLAIPEPRRISLGVRRNLVRNSSHFSHSAIVPVIFVALDASARCEDTNVAIHIDHVMVGVSNLERAVSDFEKATGVRPVFGGKHPSGTQHTTRRKAFHCPHR